MKQTVYLSDFRDAFLKLRPNDFTYEGLEILYDYFEEIDENMELDVAAICCEYNEDLPSDVAENYDIDIEGLDDNDLTETVREYLTENTLLVGMTDSTFVYLTF